MTIRPQLILPAGFNLIGIAGHAGSGKDTVAAYISETFTDTYVESFAAPLKEAAAHAFGIPLIEFQEPESKEKINGYWGVSPRMIAQFVGTELFRENIWKLLPADAQDFWIRRMFGRLSGECRHDEDGAYCAGDNIVIPDVRFPNEVDFILSNGGILVSLFRDGADGKVGIPEHASEQSLTTSFQQEGCYQLANNGTIEDLTTQVHAIITDHFGTTMTPYSISSSL